MKMFWVMTWHGLLMVASLWIHGMSLSCEGGPMFRGMQADIDDCLLCIEHMGGMAGPGSGVSHRGVKLAREVLQVTRLFPDQ